MGTASSRISNKMATTWAAILSLPVVSAARTIPSRAATTRKPVTASSRPASTMAIQASTRSDRKSTRLNSSHGYISYAVFCLKKKKKDREHVLLDDPFLQLHMVGKDSHPRYSITRITIL